MFGHDKPLIDNPVTIDHYVGHAMCHLDSLGETREVLVVAFAVSPTHGIVATVIIADPKDLIEDHTLYVVPVPDLKGFEATS
jgi:hypothetical protein